MRRPKENKQIRVLREILEDGSFALFCILIGNQDVNPPKYPRIGQRTLLAVLALLDRLSSGTGFHPLHLHTSEESIVKPKGKPNLDLSESGQCAFGKGSVGTQNNLSSQKKSCQEWFPAG